MTDIGDMIMRVRDIEMKLHHVGKLSAFGERYIWEIPDFYSLPNDKEITLLRCPVFSLCGCQCVMQMKILPNQWRGTFDEITVELLLLNNVSPVPLPAETPVTFKSGLKTPNGEIVEGNTKIAIITGDSLSVHSSIGRLSHREVRESRPEYLMPYDTLTLVCYIRIDDGYPRPNEEHRWRIHAPGLKRLSEDFEDLLLSQVGTDVVLKVGRDKFKAHRFMIKTRSPGLFAKFGGPDAQEVVDVEDCDPVTFDEFLRYVYTGRLLDELTTETALRLYRTADQCRVPGLKERCMKHLKYGLTTDNFCDVMELSMERFDSELKDAAAQFFVDNALAISHLEKWETFIQKHPETANDLNLRALLKKRGGVYESTKDST